MFLRSPGARRDEDTAPYRLADSKSLHPSKKSRALPIKSLSLMTEARPMPLSAPFSPLGVRFLDTPMPLG
jgi:hypothetical protein